MRGRFFRRIIIAFILFGLIAFGLFSALFWFVASAFNWLPQSLHARGPFSGPLGVFLAICVIYCLVRITRFIRRNAVPLGNLMEAVGRVQDGDYTVQVEERGPAEVRSLARAFNEMTGRLRANDEQRRRLLADVTHELRTPITVIQGNLEGMLDGIYPPDPERIQALLEETRVLSRIIDDLRTLSLAESGALKLQIESIQPAELLEETAEFFQGQAEKGGVAIEVNAPEPLPEVSADPTRIREVLSNLVANALRYTPPGGKITLKAAPEPDGNTPGVRLAVCDTGAGISAADVPHIFDRFYKSADSRGTGLGLAIAKTLVEAHGGKISAESVEGKGTTIAFDLPADHQNP